MKGAAAAVQSITLLPIRKQERTVVTSSLLIGLATILILAVSLNSPTHPSAMLAYSLKFVLLLLPLIFVRTSAHWFHPLIFIGIWCIAREAIPEAGLVVFGLSDHPGWRSASETIITRSTLLKFGMDCLGLLALYFGFFLGSDTFGIRASHSAPKSLELKIMVIAVVAILAAAVLASAAGGVEALSLQRGVRSDRRVTAEIGRH